MGNTAPPSELLLRPFVPIDGDGVGEAGIYPIEACPNPYALGEVQCDRGRERQRLPRGLIAKRGGKQDPRKWGLFRPYLVITNLARYSVLTEIRENYMLRFVHI